MIEIDTFIEKGNHSICQDYAIYGSSPFPYIIVSDGCSSSEDTDVGSRILTLAARNFLLHPKNYFIHYFENETNSGDNPRSLYDKMGLCIINSAIAAAKLLSLDITCLDATLIISFIINGYLYVYMYGDGNILEITNDSQSCLTINYPSGAPYYLSYNLDRLRQINHFNTCGYKKIESLILNGELNYSIDVGCKNKSVYRFRISDDSTYLISSDGLNSFKSGASKVELKDLILDMTKFKHYTGRFIERRFTRFLSNLKKDKITHFDDISVGGYHIIGDDNEISCEGKQ